MADKLVFDIEADELDIFLDEVNEHLQVMETGILRLEQEADAGILNAVFRAAHTIKALAGTVGHHRMADLTHTMENLFDAMRTGGLTATQAVVDELFSVVDVLKVLRDEIINLEASDIEVGEVLARLRALTDPSKAASKPATGAGPATGGSYALTAEQTEQVKQFQTDGHTVFVVEANTSPETFAAAARLMQAAMAMAENGEVIDQQPTMAQLGQSEHDNRLSVLVATTVAVEVLQQKLADVADLAGYQVEVLQLTEEPAKPMAVAPSRSAPNNSPAAAPDKTVRISVERLDALMNLVGELVTNRNRLQQVEDTLRVRYGKEEVVGELSESSAHMGRVVDQLQEEVMRARMLPISHIFDKFPRIVRDVARAAGKQIDLKIEGGATELDRSLIEAIGDPLIHLLRNAVDHGVEPPEERLAAGKPATGVVQLTAAHMEGQIVITVIDDGRGIDPKRIRKSAVKRGMLTEERAAQLSDEQAIDFIFQPNLSTAEKLTEVSGRGVGMDVVRTNVERLSGSVFVESNLGQGTIFRVTLPLTLAIIETMLVEVKHGVFAIPITSINDVLYLSDVSVSTITNRPAIRWRGSVLPLIDLREFFGDERLKESRLTKGTEKAVVSVTWGKQQAGMIVDRIIGKQGIVVKSLSVLIGEIPGLSGATILGDGRIALIVDVPSVMNSAIRLRRQGVKV